MNSKKYFLKHILINFDAGEQLYFDQMIYTIIKEKAISTEPPPSDTIRGDITQWEIFDSYMLELDTVILININVIILTKESSIRSRKEKRSLRIR